MHACIAAVSQGVPTVSLAYSRKFAGVMGSIGMGESVVDLTAMENARVLDRVQAIFSRRISVRQELAGKVDAIKKSALEIFSGLSETAGLKAAV